MMKKLRIAVFKLIDILVILTMVSASPMNLSAAAMAQESTPVLVTDKTDYSPGESASITGSGFPAGGYVLAADGPEGHVDWGSVTVEESGIFVSDSPALASAGMYAVRAYPAGWSGDWGETPVASASFTVTAPPPPTETPTEEPTAEPTEEPTATEPPTAGPTATEPPTAEPTQEPTSEPTLEPTATTEPTQEPTIEPVPVALLWTDKSAYLPHEIVYTLGSEFAPGDYILAASTPDGSITSWGTVIADEAGYLVYSSEVTLSGAYELRVYAANWSGEWDGPQLASASFVVNAVSSPSIRSGRPDYSPNDTVTLNGENWQGDERVRLFINDDDGQTWSRTVTVDVAEDGTFTDSFTLPDWFVATYTVTGTGQQTNRIAKMTFADSAIYIVDDQGADDEPGQKDLNFLTVDYNPPTPGTILVGWGWDDTAWSGNNTGDACTLFDTDSDGFANYSLCVTVEKTPAVFKSSRLYSCGDTRADRCDQPTTLIPGFTSTASASVVPNSDPFGVPSSPYYDPSHVVGNTCDAKTGCYTADTVSNVTVKLSDVGGGTAKLINVCSYPSQEPNSAPAECVITPNNGFLTILKSASPNDATGFTFNLGAGQSSQDGTSSWTINGSGSVQLISFAPGTTYDLSEVIPASWDLTSASCSVQTAPPTSTGTSTTTGINDFTIQSGLETFCTFTNAKRGRIIVDKVTTPSGDPTSFNFDANGGTSPTYNDFSLTDAATPNDQELKPGSYSVSETVPTGWNLSSSSCTSSIGDSETPGNIELDAGETVTCTFNNQQQAATLIVKKIVINDDGGTKTASDFSFSVNGGTATAFEADGQNDLTVSTGTYSVTEPAVAGYSTTYNNCSNLVIPPGGSATCTITNDDQPATLIVIKHVINDNGGTATAADFTLDSGGPNDSPDNFAGAEVPGTTVTLDAGAYNVTETGPAGYSASFSADCSGAIANGETKTCTVTNNDNAATLIVIKHVINDNGGTASAGDFTMDVTATNPSDASFPGEETPGTTITVDAGSYSVSETGPSGYAASYSADCSGTIANGETKTCTVTNDDQAATLIVKKVVINDNGGTLDAEDFTFQVNGGVVTSFEADGQNDLTVDAGTYTVTEPAVSGYTTTYDNCTDLIIPNGGSATCTITNNDQAATLIVKKIVINDNGGILEADDFSFQVNSGAVTPFEADGQNDLSVSAGTYTVTEPAVSGYTTTYDNCSNLVIPNGGSATCTITNDDQAAHLKLVKVVSNDNGGTATTADFTLSASGPTPISGAGGAESDVNAGTYTLSETSVPGYSASAWSCVGGTQNGSDITLANGQSATCTITNHDNAPSLELVKVVINDNGGLAETTDFILSANGPTPISGAGGASSDASFQAGTYTLAETGPSAYSASAWVCTGGGTQNGNEITLGLDESATCTITNDDDAPSLTLVKEVVNDNGGQATAADFTLSADGPTPISGAGGATSDATFEAGTYDLSETTMPGYTASDWICVGGTQDDEDTVTVGLGEDVTCTITNDDNAPSLTLVKVLVNDNGGTATEANFTLTATGPTGFAGPGPSVSNGASFDAGTYALSESGPAGYTASAWSCVGGTQNGSDITLGLGESATCTITNDDNAPSLTLVKVVVNDNGGTALTTSFTLSASGPTPISGAGGASSDATFDAGTYNLSETGPDGYTASDWVCSGGTQDDADTITLGLGESATCTITNDDQAPSLTLVKVVTNDDGGNAVESDWTLTATGPTGFSGPGPAVSNGTSFDAGTYDLSESGPAGYTASDWVCVGGTQDDADSITLDLGQSATCTITNDDVAPTLKLVKVVTNDNGGNANANDWVLYAVASAPDEGRNFSNAGGSGDFEPVFANTAYDLSESVVAGYTAGSWSCTGGTLVGSTLTLSEGETGITCTITNDDSAPTLTLIKIVVNDDGGNAVVADFPLFINGNPVTSGVANTLSANVLYTASETNLAGYAPSTWAGDCNADGTITLDEGENATCTITNDDVAPTLKLVKIVDNGDGGNAIADDWTLSADAASPFDDRNFSNPGGSGVFETVFANQGYDLSETTLPGYTAGTWSCTGGNLAGSTVTLAEGENVTCTITNDDSAPTLTLIKTVVNDDGGNAAVSDFPLFINGNPVTSGASNSLSANTLYTATETNLAGYTASAWGGDCNADGTITLDEGENAICTITNNDVAPTLKLVKDVVNDNGGNAGANDWTLSADAAAPFDDRNFSNAGGSGVFETVFANAGYDLSESTVAGYAAGSWSCDGGTLVGSTVTLNEGETEVTCTITNDDSAPTLTLIKNVINDNGGNAQPNDFSLTIGGNAALSGVTYTLSANTPYAVNETLLSGYTFVNITGDPECPAVLGGTVTLDEGENITCTITNDDVAPTLTLIKNVINDNGGNALPDDFSLTIGGNAAMSGTAYAVDANTPYDINETLLTGYSFVSITGDAECPAVLGGTVTLDEGENVTCTITNNDQPATLIIIKHVINDNGGTADASDFTLDSGGTDDAPDDFPGEEAPGKTVTLDAGAYNVTETGPSGYSASFSADCSGTIANGETKTCTVTNDDIQPQLIVIKHVINDNGGTALASAFTMNVTGDNANPASFPGDESGTTVALDAGSYSVGETGPSGYAASYSTDCTGSIAVGETKTCTVTNNDISPTLTVFKVLLPGNDTGLFNLQIDGVTQAADVGDNGTTGPIAVNAGVVHTVGETAGTGTSLSDYVTSISGDCALDGTVTLALAENKTCTITNVRRGSIVIVKNALGGDGTFDFTSTSFGPFSLTTSSGTASTTFSGLDPANTYDVAESVPAGWELNSATCDSGETIDNIDLDPGETVTCTFENEKAGSIIVVKNTVGGEGTFDFTSGTLGDFSLTTASNTASTTFSNLDVDLTYDVAETVPAGWDLTSATCDSGETIESIDLDPGETVTCTFTNTKRAIIVITKEAIPDDPQDFSFTATESTDTPIPDFTLDDDADGTLPKTMTFTDLKPGDYTVTETLVAGWDLNGMSCASTVNLNSGVNVNINTATATINLGAGDTVVCTFGNTKRGHIIVDKVTNPAGDLQSFSFDATGGFSPVYTDFNLTDASAPNDQELRPGIYSVTETLPAGWDLESATCTSSIGDTETPGSIELDPGETVNCTFTNEKDAFIIVEKQTDPNADPTLFDFTTDYGPAFQLSDGQTNNSGDLDPGTYSVTETLPAGWDLESVTCSDGSDPSSISLQAGETVTCVFTNEKDAFIIVEKQTIPDGDPQVFDFDLNYGTGDADLSDGQTDNSGDLDPGTYSVSENVPSGWDLTSAVCSDGSSASIISLQAGETVTCVFTNTKRGHIIVDKVTLPSGDAQSFAFTTTGTGYSGFNLTDAAAPNDQTLVPGTYSVTETALTGWDLTGLSCTDPSGAPVIAGNKATINLAAGETVNCTFTNTKRGKITIVKDALPNDAQDFSFTSAALGNFSLDDDGDATLSNTKTVINLVPGAYSVTEGAVAGWDLTGLTCNDANGTTNLGTRTASIALDPGENVTCTFTNTKRGTIIVEKQTNPNGAPGNFTFTGTAAGTIADNGTITVANLVPGTYTSTEADPAVTLFALTSIVCNDGSSANPSTGNLAARTATFKLDPGETVKCVFTNTKDFHAGTIGFWKNWRNHYTTAQSQLLINYLKSNNPKIYNKDLILNNSDDFTIAKWDAIFNLGTKTPREQMILAQFTALKLNLAITQLDGTSGLVQKNDDLCTAGIVDVSGISGAATFFGTSTPTVGQIVNAVENRWTGKLTTNRSDWKWNLTTSQKDMLIKVITGINEGTLVMSSGCP